MFFGHVYVFIGEMSAHFLIDPFVIFLSFIVSFEEQKFLILIQIKLSICNFVTRAFALHLRNYYLKQGHKFFPKFSSDS